jgi:hypothetical protein
LKTEEEAEPEEEEEEEEGGRRRKLCSEVSCILGDKNGTLP